MQVYSLNYYISILPTYTTHPSVATVKSLAEYGMTEPGEFGGVAGVLTNNASFCSAEVEFLFEMSNSVHALSSRRPTTSCLSKYIGSRLAARVPVLPVVGST